MRRQEFITVIRGAVTWPLAGEAAASSRTAGPSLRLVQGRLRHARPEGGV